MKNYKFGFNYDLNKARVKGNFFERIFHNTRLKFWLSVVEYKNKKILDIGCNTGILLIPLLEKGYNVVGIDNSLEDIKIARKSLRKKNLPESTVKVADAQKIPFKTNFFDVIILSDVLEHVIDVECSAKEALRVAKKGGIILASVPNECHPVVKYSWVRKMLTGRMDVDEHLDMPFNKKKLSALFPKTITIRLQYIGFRSEILGIFKKI